jgi:hypothetical protein
MQRVAKTQGIDLFAGCIHFDWQKAMMHWNPESLQERIGDVAASLQKSGLRPGEPVFHAAHSLSTTLLQDCLQSGVKTNGQILLGGCLLRKYSFPIFTYRVPTLTVGAQFDGEESIIRQAEQHLVHKQLDQEHFPYVVLEGQNHMQFASGNRPSQMKQELPPTVDDGTAHQAIGDVAIDFMKMRLDLPTAGRIVKEQVQRTSTNLLPVLLAQDASLHGGLPRDDTGPALFL